MQLQLTEISKVDDDSIKDAYIYFYIAIEQCEHFGEKNIIAKAVNTSMINILKEELKIRDIDISKLITRAITIIKINSMIR